MTCEIINFWSLQINCFTASFAFWDYNSSKKLEAKDVLPNINRTQAAEGPKNAVFVPGGLDLQYCANEGPNTSSMWICRRSVHRFPEIFHTQTKKPQTDGGKNRTFRTSLCISVCGKKINTGILTEYMANICTICRLYDRFIFFKICNKQSLCAVLFIAQLMNCP